MLFLRKKNNIDYSPYVKYVAHTFLLDKKITWNATSFVRSKFGFGFIVFGKQRKNFSFNKAFIDDLDVLKMFILLYNNTTHNTVFFYYTTRLTKKAINYSIKTQKKNKDLSVNTIRKLLLMCGERYLCTIDENYNISEGFDYKKYVNDENGEERLKTKLLLFSKTDITTLRNYTIFISLRSLYTHSKQDQIFFS